MILVVAAMFALGLGALARRGWSPAMRAAAAWAGVRPVLWVYIRAAPATFSYLAILTVTTWVLMGSSDRLIDLLLREHSTNLHQLSIDPVRVLVRSAFWVPGYGFLAWALLFTVVLAPAEHWLGTRRCVAVFAMGHVLASLGTVVILWLAIRYSKAPSGLADSVDVGVSYGFAAVAAIFTFRLPPRWRPGWVAALVGLALAALLVSRTFTDVGHILALGVGFASYPLTTRASVRSRRADPLLFSVGRFPLGRRQP